jgi:hypothetical protein
MDNQIIQKKDRYKRVTLWDSLEQKRRCITLTIADYPDEKALKETVDKLKADNKERNKQIRLEHKQGEFRQRLAAVSNTEFCRTNISADFELPDILKPKADVSLRLDHGTGNTTLIFGSSKRGKSTLQKFLYDKYYNTKTVNKRGINTMFAGNPQLSIYKHDKHLLIGDGFNAKSAKYIKMQKYINSKTHNKYKFLNMFDDILDTKYSSIVNQLVLSYRNSNISLLMCLQYVYMLSKQNRANINNTFVFGSNTYEDEKNLIETFLKPYFYALGFRSNADHICLYRKVTADYGFFYIDNLKGKISAHRLVL